MIKERYKIKNVDNAYFVYLKGRGWSYKIPLELKTECEALTLINILKSEYSDGLIEGKRLESHQI